MAAANIADIVCEYGARKHEILTVFACNDVFNGWVDDLNFLYLTKLVWAGLSEWGHVTAVNQLETLY